MLFRRENKLPQTTPPSPKGHALCLGLAIVAAVGCRQRDDRTSRLPDRDIAEASSPTETSNLGLQPELTESTVVIPLDKLGLADARVGESSDLSTWTTEQWSSAIGQQLTVIGEYLRSGTDAAREKLEPIADGSFSGRLRPRTLQNAFQDGVIGVRRQTRAQSAEEPLNELPGHVAFAKTLDELRAPLQAAHHVENHFKVIRITQDSPTRFGSRILFEQHGDLDGNSVQQRAFWDCTWAIGTDRTLQIASVSLSDYEETTARVPPAGDTQPAHLFTDCTQHVLGKNSSFAEQLSQSTDHWLDRLEFRYGIDPGAWLGMALGDVNGDGLDDVYVCQPGGLPNRLYVQQADGTAVDRSQDAGLDWLDHSHSSLFVDLDNDGDQDLVIAVKAGLIFLENDGRGNFQVAAVRSVPQSNPYALSAADFDADGLLDVYVACYSQRRSETDRQFIQRPIPYHDANNGGRNQLLRNEGNFQFRDVTNVTGLDGNNRRFSFAASWEDYDNDGDIDLYVANDYGRNNLYRNDGGSFTDVAATAGVEDISAGMSVTWGDYNNDGWMDLYVSNMFSSAGNRIAYQRQFREEHQNQKTLADYQRHAKGNSLFVNMGDGTFQDVSEPAGVTIGRWAWSSLFADINNDGWEDILVANGFITQQDTDDL
ncbi:MAG: VCBS repeat-containing protein [Planctomycetales bacterium]|nr:VCBS repeat-containing protein [Planctomycetales bacterium]